MPPPRRRLGQLLLELGVIDEHQLQSALGHQKQWGGKLGGILVQKGFCAEDDVVAALTKHLGMQRVRLAEAKIDPRAIKCVSKPIAEKLHVLPYELSGSGRSEVVTIAMSDPTDLSAVDQLAFHTGKRIKPMLAGDGEIVAAIHAHYGGGDDKKEPTDKVARPAAPQAAGGQGSPAGSVAGFPKRIDPAPPAAATAGPRAAPYIPPPIPIAKPAAPVQKLEEIEPEDALPRAPPAPIVPPPLDLPEDDGQEFGLEPIAAHSQFGDAVAGQEDVAGEGTAGDAVEGLVSASLAHAGAAEARQMDGLDAIAAPEPVAGDSSGWTGPILDVEHATTSGNGWAKGGEGQTGWDVSAPVPAEGWAAEPLPSTGWTVPISTDASALAGWSSPDSGSEADAPGEALPADAILGTAPILGPDGAAAQTAATESALAASLNELLDDGRELPAAPSSGPPIEFEDPASETDAPDAWASSEDPLASQAALDDPLASGSSLPDALGGASSFDDPLAVASGDGRAAESEALDPMVPASGAEQEPQFSDRTDRIEIPPAHEADSGEPQFGGGEASWIGEALEGGTPLSPADLGTLASIGVDPGDGVGALRLLAVLVRILNRNQLIEPGDLREEIRESQLQGAAAAATHGYAMESPESAASAEPGNPAETAET